MYFFILVRIHLQYCIYIFSVQSNFVYLAKFKNYVYFYQSHLYILFVFLVMHFFLITAMPILFKALFDSLFLFKFCFFFIYLLD